MTIERYGKVVSYPGDTSVLEDVSGFLNLFMSDINLVSKKLRGSLDNMSNKYWYRDVLRWLGVLFITLKPYE